MAWKDEMVVILRALINDLSDTPENSDDHLQTIIVVSALQVQQNMDFDTEYSINVSVPEITPDPTSPQDEDFVTLVSMKAACIMARAEQRKKAKQAYNIKDGPSNIDGRAPAEQTTKWADTICADYAKAELQYNLGNRQAGKAIIGPYRYDSSRYQTPISPRSSEHGFFS